MMIYIKLTVSLTLHFTLYNGQHHGISKRALLFPRATILQPPESSRSFIQHVDDTIDLDESDLTPIHDFYQDAKIFRSGSTGFLGQILIEKLLRSCPVATIYLLMRGKKGKDVFSRLDSIFDDCLFDRMKRGEASRIIEKFQHVDDAIDLDESDLTPIQDFYQDAKIFITGGTGFLGQILIEKLLRSCPVTTIYLLMRGKKGKDVGSRLDSIFDDCLFDRMKKACPNFRQKIVIVQGDCVMPGLGLNDEDRKLLINEVNIVFHVAATVRFDEKLKDATFINVRATRDISRLVQQMPNLKSFLYVSTTYSNCIHDEIEEKIYPATIDSKHLIDTCENLDDLVLENMTEHFLGDYPNTYAFSKQIAEDVIGQETKGLPAGIYRPAIVISTYKEPTRGWINNFYGPTAIFFGCAVGLLRVLYCDGDSAANMVPVDMCVNGLIASAWHVAQEFSKGKDLEEDFVAPVYNYESTNDKLITWYDYKRLGIKYSRTFPLCLSTWIYALYLVKSYNVYLVLVLFLHLIPGAIGDTILSLKGKRRRLVKAYKKIYSFSALLAFFAMRNFKFCSTNVHEMLSRMSLRDREIFFCDFRELNWDDYFETYGLGTRVYLGKDPIDTLPEARKHFKRLYLAHIGLKTILGVLGITLLWLVASTLYRLTIHIG